MWINLDIETLSKDFFFFLFFNNTHYAGCLMSGMTSLLTFELQYLSQCLVLSWHLRNICWMNACFILLYPSMISEWFCDFFQVNDILYASAIFHMFVSVLLLTISKLFSLFLSFVVPYISVYTIVFVWLWSS